MKVLIATNAYPSLQKPYAGVFVRNQVEYLRDSADDIEYSVFSMPRNFTGFLGSVAKYFSAAVRFSPNFIKKYDVVHLHFFFPLIWLCWIYCFFYKDTRLVVTIHGTDVIGRFHNPVSRFLHKKLANRITTVISVGNAVGKEFSDRLGRRVDHVIPAGIDDRVFRKQDASKCYDLIFVGSFYEKKGFDLLILSLKQIDQSLKACVVGSGPLENMVDDVLGKHVIETKKNLTQPEIAALINKSRFFILPSRSEPFGLAASEALYCGTPAIVSKADGLTMQVVNGVNGFVTDNDPETLSQTIRNALNLSKESYDEMSRSASESNKQYSLSNVCQKLMDIYRNSIDVADEKNS